MPSDSGTVVAVKSVFLRSQIRILSQPLQLTDKWREGFGMPKTALQDVMNEVNRILQRHNDSVYYPLAIRAISQQIDQLYWESAAPSSTADDTEDAEIGALDDLARDEAASKLPDSWDDSEEYAELLNRLRSSSARRAELQRKLVTYRQLQSLTAPFRDPQRSIQPNLVTKDGPLTKELERNREVGIRLAGALAGRKRRREEGN